MSAVGSAILLAINTSAPISEGSDFICANLDWWPASKCDYGRCPWGRDSLLNLNLETVRPALSALSMPTRAQHRFTLRLGGSMADYIQYNTSAVAAAKCIPWTVTHDTRLGYELYSWSSHSVVGPCLQVERLVELLRLCDDVGCRIAFGVNAMDGRRLVAQCPAGTDCWKGKPTASCCTQWEGAWDPAPTGALLRALKRAGVMPWALEFGNELVGSPGIEAHLNVTQYYSDFLAFATLVRSVWPAPADAAATAATAALGTPLLVTPDTSWSEQWYEHFMDLGPPADVVTRHEYTLGAGVDPASEARSFDPTHLDALRSVASNAGNAFVAARPKLARALPAAHVALGYPQLWVGEAGGCYNSGRPNVTDAFGSAFWWLDNMAIEAAHHHAQYCRQTLAGGSYSLLATKDGRVTAANPDYFAARLWRKLMGKRVLSVTLQSAPKTLRAYAHCSDSAGSGGVTVLVLNLDTARHAAAATVQVSLTGDRYEYHMMAETTATRSMSALEKRRSRRVALNGAALTHVGAPLDQSRTVRSGTPLVVEPVSYAFVVFPGANAAACR